MANGQWFTQINNGTLTLLDTTSQNETFKGTKGDDTFAGGFGNDTYVIKSPGDTVTGGLGADIFQISATGTGSHAEITDFSVSDGDAISLLLLDADPRTAARNAFTFVGAHGFSGTVGELRYAVSGGNTFIYGDTNGDRAADFTIMVDGIHTFTAADFLL